VIASAVDPSLSAAELLERGFVYVRAGPSDKQAAWAVAHEVFRRAGQIEPLAFDMPAPVIWQALGLEHAFELGRVSRRTMAFRRKR
jgi:hypothetical protein